jgi:tRNA(adenine34) deaminase
MVQKNILQPFTHEYFMKEALKEAQLAFEKDEVPVGAVVVWRNKVIAKAHNLTETLNDPTAHAEMQALTSAANAIGGKYLNECTLYVTIEPCPMCAGACFWAQLGNLIYGADDTKRGYSFLNSKLLHPKTIAEKGVKSDECAKLMTDFFKKKR